MRQNVKVMKCIPVLQYSDFEIDVRLVNHHGFPAVGYELSAKTGMGPNHRTTLGTFDRKEDATRAYHSWLVMTEKLEAGEL